MNYSDKYFSYSDFYEGFISHIYLYSSIIEMPKEKIRLNVINKLIYFQIIKNCKKTAII